MLPVKFYFIWPICCRGEDFKKSTNQKQELPMLVWWPCLSTDKDKISTIYRGPSIDAPYKVLVYCPSNFRSERKRFFSIFQPMPPSFRGEDCFQYFSQSETELPMATMFFVQLG